MTLGNMILTVTPEPEKIGDQESGEPRRLPETVWDQWSRHATLHKAETDKHETTQYD